MPPLDSLAPSRAESAPAALAERLRPVVLRLSRNLRREAQRFGVSALDAQLMTIVLKNAGIGVSELAEREQISKPAMSAHVKRLEEAGWIARDADSEDKRRVGLLLTKAGARALEDIRKSRNDWLAARLAKLSAADRASLAGALTALTELAEDGR